MSEERKLRTHVYLARPADYEISGCECGNADPEWSEFESHLWCPKCQKDFIPTNNGIFDGPIPVNTVELMGITLDRRNIETGRIETFHQDQQISELTRQLAEKDRTAQLQIDASIEIQDIYENKILQLESELIQDKETIRILSNSDVTRSIAAGVEDIAAGRVTPLEKVRAELAGRHDWCANCGALAKQLAEATERAEKAEAELNAVKNKLNPEANRFSLDELVMENIESWFYIAAENKRLQLELDAARKDAER